MGSKKACLLESLSDKCIMQSCTSFLRGFSSRLRVEDSDTSYLNLCVRGDQAAKDNSEERHSRELTVNVIYLNLIFLIKMFALLYNSI